MADLTGVNGQRKTFRVVGKPNLPGLLSKAMATGVAKYCTDYVVPDMLHAKFLRSPHAHAKIKSLNKDKAKSIPGVVEVLTWEDDEIKTLKAGGGFGGGSSQGFLTDTANQNDEEVGVVVVAESIDICEEALRALDVEWEILPHVVDVLEGRKSDAPVIQPPKPAGGMGGGFGGGYGGGRSANPPKKGNVSYSNVNQGDVEAGFKDADHIVEYDLTLPAFCNHISNPMGAVAWWAEDPNGGGTKLHIEGAPWEHDSIAMMYRMGGSKTTQECMLVGGRYCDWGMRKSQSVTPMLAKKTGRPVRCMNTRQEMYDFGLNQKFTHIKIGFKKNGLITAIHDFSIADGGTPGSSMFGTNGDQSWGPYFTTKCVNIKQDMDIVDSNRGFMYVSGQHNPMNWDALTVGLHVIAEKLGKDPIEIATTNLHGPDSQNDTRSVASYETCVKELKKHMKWKWHKAGAKKLPDGRLHGASFRYQMCPRHSFSGYNTKLELRDGVIHLPSKGPIIGQYVLEANAMVIAEELGLEYKDISIDLDVSYTYRPYGGGSDGTTASSWALKECANKLKEKILQAAVDEAANSSSNPLKGKKPEDLDMQGGKIVLKSNPKIGVPLKKIEANLVQTFNGRPPTAIWAQGMGKKLDAMNVASCEVAVDPETGKVEIQRFVVFADVGKVMRLTSLESQIDQVMYFSQGCQLTEDFIFDKKTGVRLNTNILEYKKPTIMDFPKVHRKFPETRAANAAYGASGISHSLANTHLVICAIHNAIGKWVDPPATPERILKALGKV